MHMAHTRFLQCRGSFKRGPPRRRRRPTSPPRSPPSRCAPCSGSRCCPCRCLPGRARRCWRRPAAPRESARRRARPPAARSRGWGMNAGLAGWGGLEHGERVRVRAVRGDEIRTSLRPPTPSTGRASPSPREAARRERRAGGGLALESASRAEGRGTRCEPACVQGPPPREGRAAPSRERRGSRLAGVAGVPMSPPPSEPT